MPVIVDFDEPDNRDIQETVVTLAYMSRFIIVDITDPRSVPAELTAITPNLTTVPIRPIVYYRSKGYALFEHLTSYQWVIEPYKYKTSREIINSIKDVIITPSEELLEKLKSK